VDRLWWVPGRLPETPGDKNNQPTTINREGFFFLLSNKAMLGLRDIGIDMTV
jgi:hypothetical protein